MSQAGAARRNSRFGWAESLPSDWEEAHLRWLATIYAGGTPDKQRAEFWDGGVIPWINSGTVNQVLVTQPSAYITEQGLVESSARWVPQSALVMALAGQGKTKGMVAQMAIQATCNQSMAAIVPTGLEPRFLFYWLTAHYRRIRSMVSDDLRDGLNLQMVGDIPCPIPASKTDQARIANFLDEKTARIDALIAEKRNLLDVLAEFRQSTISWLVTGGGRQPTQETGDLFVPTVPAGWQLASLTKFIGPVVDYRGRTPEKVDEGILLVTAKNVRDGRLDYAASAEYVRADEYEGVMRRGRPELGDVLFTTEAPLGQVANVDRLDIALAQRIVKFRGVPGALDNYFLKYWLMGHAVQATLQTLATGSTAEGIKASKLGQIPLAVPPIREQRAIVALLDDSTEAIDEAVEHVKEHVERLREYRSSLISAAVTDQLNLGTTRVAA